MTHMGSDHRSVVAYFRFPCSKKSDPPSSQEQKEDIRRSTRCTHRDVRVETQELSESVPRIQERYVELERKSLGKASSSHTDSKNRNTESRNSSSKQGRGR